MIGNLQNASFRGNENSFIFSDPNIRRNQISVIVPTHNLQFIHTLFRSIELRFFASLDGIRWLLLVGWQSLTVVSLHIALTSPPPT